MENQIMTNSPNEGTSSSENRDHNITKVAQVAIVSGANTGIGSVTAKELARAGFEVYLACKSLLRAQPIIDSINAHNGPGKAFYLELDLENFESVRACAEQFLNTNKPLHLLINNAGVAGKKGKTKSGFEMAFGINHMGHFLLTQLLLDRLKSSSPSRIVTVASRAHKRAPGEINWLQTLEPTRTWTGITEYAISKLANIQFSAELAKHLHGTGVATYSLHPGVVQTEVWRELPVFLRPLLKLRGMLTPEEGAKTTLHCALVAPLEQSGLYYANSAIESPSVLAQNSVLQKQLWDLSLQWVDKYL